MARPAFQSSLVTPISASEAPTELGAVAPQRRHLGGVLEPLELEPGLQERGVGVEVAGIDVDAGGVPAVHQHLVERRAAAAHRVEDVERTVVGRPVIGPSDRPDRHVEQQLGEQLVGLALVLEDRQQVVVEAVASRELDGCQGGAVALEQRHRGGDVAEQLEVVGGEVGVEGDVRDAGDPGRLRVPETVAQPGHGEHAELGDGEGRRRECVHAVGRRQHEQGVRRHVRQSGLACGS